MPELWYRILLRLTTRIYYRRVRVVHLSPVTIGEGPVLFVGLHRNGAVDGMLYKSIFPRAVFLIARRLLRSWFTRLYFTGIPVTREHDDDASARRDNPRSLAAAVDHLASGGQLCILPEGTSDLGPQHLPFRPGVAKVIAATVERGVTPLVVPMGIFYECAPAFRSDVCIVIGAPIDITLDQSLDRPKQVAELMARITASLEGIAVEAEDAGTLHRIETLAALTAEDIGATRWRAQKMLTRQSLDATIEHHWTRLAAAVCDRAGVPRVSRHGMLWNLLWLLLQLPVVTLAALLNVVPLVGAWLAGRRLADAPNTIALWRILVGAPLMLLWLLVIALGTALHSFWWLVGYACATGLGLVAYPELCLRWPMLRNSIGRPSLRDDAIAIRHSLLVTLAEGSRG